MSQNIILLYHILKILLILLRHTFVETPGSWGHLPSCSEQTISLLQQTSSGCEY